jgi:Na+-transporting NADH:ubiquinone oxidoreductase subunit F
MIEITLGIATFTVIILLLSLLVLSARRLLVPAGSCEVNINNRITVNAPVGHRLLEVLTKAGVNLPSSCGGAGTCGLCKARVDDKDSVAKPQELALLSRAEIAQGVRLACQVPVLHPLKVEVDDACFGVNSWQCTVESTHNVATLIREIVLKLPEGESLNFRPGSFVQVSCPGYTLSYADLEIDPEYRNVWNQSGLLALKAGTPVSVTRAYSMANRPSDKKVIRLNVRIALPPPGSHNIAPGTVSSWLFSLNPGDKIEVSGCFGHFLVEPSDCEAVFIGGGVGMAPLYAQITDLLDRQHSKRKISFWYGVRSKRDLYYSREFERLQKENENFSWQVALSEPQPEDKWQGPTGFIHNVISDQYLNRHKTPEDCEYYLCGPPMMVKAVYSILGNLGVEPINIHYDDFGGG